LNRIDLIHTDEARVARIVLSPNEITTKHFHSEVVENVVCLDGCIEVHEVDNKTKVTKLVPGEIHEISPGVVHHLINALETESEYLLVQKGNYDFETVDA
jgi:quercetin dioxygenase-like cupin family protein